jgi:hypothetical protein
MGQRPRYLRNLPAHSVKRSVVVRTMIGSIGPTAIDPAGAAKLSGSRGRLHPFGEKLSEDGQTASNRIKRKSIS